jgi:hypothetical protein
MRANYLCVLFCTLSVSVLFAVACKKSKETLTASLPINDHDTAFVHPGLLHTAAAFERMQAKVAAGTEPWLSGWNKLTANAHSSTSWAASPQSIVYRGADGVHPENYSLLFNDIAAAYASALRWKVSGDEAYARKSISIMNAWSAQLTKLAGNNDSVLAAGLYGYEFANAGEIMRTYKGWSASDLARFQRMMLNVFYKVNHTFITRWERCMGHYYANWDLCNMCSLLAIGVLCDDRSIYNEAITYFKYGAGNGNIKNAVYYIHDGGLGQWQESGRDQGHSTLGIALMGAFCEMAWSQGDDMYGYDDNRFLKGAEYVAKYNAGQDVPYVAYTNCLGVDQEIISADARGNVRPIWELVYNHYVKLKGLSAPYTTFFAEKVRPEGGGGNYSSGSGGYDQLGYGTLTCTLSDAQ